LVTRPFYIVDVFAEEKYAGNQLAVVRNAGELSDREMQRIARETNFSETTFILNDKQRDGGYDVRIFTPMQELPFAGHPTLGTAFIIRNEILKKPDNRVILNLKVGQIPVDFEHDGGKEILWMTQKEPSYAHTFQAGPISEVLGLATQEIDSRFPIEEVSTGAPFIIVPLKTLAAIRKISVNRTKYLSLVKDIESKAIVVFCPETLNPENQLHVRVFVEYFGIPEDPATGSGNGCLAAYLVKHKYFGTDHVNVKVEQGYEIGRPSLLYLRAEPAGGSIRVQVGGRVQSVAKGELV
jgi:trans-2,3-dihydro-3-hydroxyanthranilate isomerase